MNEKLRWIGYAMMEGALLRGRPDDPSEFIFSVQANKLVSGAWGCVYEHILGRGRPIPWKSPEEAEWITMKQVRRAVHRVTGVNIFCESVPLESGISNVLVFAVQQLAMTHTPEEIGRILMVAAEGRKKLIVTEEDR